MPDSDLSYLEPEDSFSSAQKNLNLAEELSPDEEAKYFKQAFKTGKPLPLVRAHKKTELPPNVDLQSSHALRSYLGQSVNNAAVSKDDLDKLSYLERVVSDEPSWWERLAHNMTAGSKDVVKSSLGSVKGFADFFREMDKRTLEAMPEEARIKELARRKVAGTENKITVIDPEELGAISRWAADVRDSDTLKVDEWRQREGVSKYIDALERTAPQIFSQYLAAILTGGAGSSSFMASQIIGGEYNNLEREGIDPVTALQAGMANAVLQTPLEEIGLGAALKVWKPGRTLGKVFKDLLESMGTEFVTEWMQEYPEAASEIWAQSQKKGQGLSEAVDEFFSRFGEITESGIFSGLVSMPFAGVTSVVNTTAQAMANNNWVERQTEINQAVNNTKTKERSPEHMEMFLNENGYGEEVFIAPEGIESLFQTDPQAATDLLQRVGIDPDKARQAANMGQDVKVSLSKVHAHLSAEEFEAIKPDLKQSPHAFSQRENKKGATAEEIKRLSDQYEEAVKDEEGFHSELDRIRGQVKKAGLSEEYADNCAQLLERFSNRMALEGQDRVEFLKKVDIKEQRFVGTDGQVYNQVPLVDKLGFFSATQKAVQEMDFKSIPANDLAARIKKTQGLKQEELEHLGMIDWLEGMGKGKVTKEQVSEFIKAGGVQLEEVRKGEKLNNESLKRQALSDAIVEVSDIADTLSEQDREAAYDYIDRINSGIDVEASKASVEELLQQAGENRTFDEMVQEQLDGLSKEDFTESKFQKWQMEGEKSNYREVLLKLPDAPKLPRPLRDKARAFAAKISERLGNEFWDERDLEGEEKEEWIRLNKEANREDVEVSTKEKKEPKFTSGHWDEPNVLAHFRLNDRVDSEGRKTLFVEEIQSDWHQKGRTKGYFDPKVKGEYTKARQEYKAFMDKMREKYNRSHIVLLAEMNPSEADESMRLSKKVADLENKTKGVPVAPFKSSWPLLALKRILRMAVEEGYDAIAWTPGEVQADRYDLSKYIDRIEYGKNAWGELTLSAIDKSGKTIWASTKTTPAELENVIGKELAQRIAQEEPKLELGKSKTLSGLDLKVGGEGMVGFYDKMLPNILGKYVKKLDKQAKVRGEKIETFEPGELDPGLDPFERKFEEEEMREESLVDVWSLPLTDKLKNKIMEGQALFQAQENQPRGAINITNEKHLVSLFESKNLSTLIHETGHIFLKEIQTLAESGQASPRLLKDYAKIRNWLGMDEGQQEFEKAHHEQFARGFEAYLMEGKAPTMDLVPVFARFRRWLTEVYKSVKNLNVHLTNDIRKVFDRLLTANAEITEAAQREGIAIKKQEELDAMGVGWEDQAYMKRLVKKAKQKAEDNLNRDRSRNYRNNIKQWRAEAAEEVDNRPVYRDIADIIKVGGMSRAEYEYHYGSGELIRTTPKNQFDPEHDTLSRWVQLQGGFKTTGEFRGELKDMFSIKEGAGGGYLNNKTGLHPDRMRERAVEAGWINGDVSTSDFLELVNTDLTARKQGDNAGRIFHQSKQLFGEVRGDDLLENVSAGNLEVGDKFTIRGEPHEVISEEDGVLHIQAAGGMDMEVDPFDQVPIDGGLAGVNADAQVARKLPDRRLLRNGGASLDEVAFAYNYEDADHLITTLTDTPPRRVAIEGVVNQKIADHDSQYQPNDYLVRTNEYADYLGILARYLRENEAKGGGGDQPEGNPRKTISRQVYRELAEKTFSGTSIRDAMRTDRYLAAMRKAGREESSACARKDWGQAARANERVRVNYELAGMSAKIKKEVDKIHRLATRLAKRDPAKFSVDIDGGTSYRDAVLDVVNRFNLGMVAAEPHDAIVAHDSLMKLIQGNADTGIDPFYGSQNVLYARKDYRDLSVEEMTDVGNLLAYLDANGKADSEKRLADGRLVQDVSLGMADESAGLKQKKMYDRYTKLRRMHEKARTFWARFDSLDPIMTSMGGYKSLGPKGTQSLCETEVSDRIHKVQNEKGDMVRNDVKELMPHYKQILRSINRLKKIFGNKMKLGVDTPEIIRNFGQVDWWTPGQIFSLALHIGNESNKSRIFSGFPGLTDPGLNKLLNVLTTKDMDAIQAIWDFNDKKFDAVNEVHFRKNGYYRKKIPAVAFEFKGKTYRGGYAPVRYDFAMAKTEVGTRRIAEIYEKEDLMSRSESVFQIPAPKSGFVKERAARTTYPLKLSLSTVFDHIVDTAHYITHTETIRDVDRLTRDGAFMEAVRNHLGQEVYDGIRPAISYVARPERMTTDPDMERASATFKRAVTAWYLAYNFSVGAKQMFSSPAASVEMGKIPYLKGMSVYLTPWKVKGQYDFMMESSAYMRDRQNNFDIELKGMFDLLDPEAKALYFGDKAVTWDDVVAFGFLPIKVMDNATVIPIWKGAYDKVMAESGNDPLAHEKAVRYADNIVRKTQPSAQAVDLTRAQRESGLWNVLTMFSTFTIGKYQQRLRLNWRAMRSGAISKAQYMNHFLFEQLVPAVGMNLMFSYLYGKDMDDEDTWSQIIAGALEQMVTLGLPVVGNWMYPFVHYEASVPMVSVAQDVNRDIKKVGNDISDQDWEALAKDGFWGMAKLLSLVYKVPVTKVIEKAQKGAEQDEESVPGIKYVIPAPKR